MARSIYDNPYKYACKCNVPYELAKIACKKYRHLMKEQRKHKPVCPVCGSKKLYWVSGSYEEGYGAFIECNDCGSGFDEAEVKNADYLPMYGDDFDAVLYFSSDPKEGWLQACGSDKLEDWNAFARKMIIGNHFVN